MLSWLWSTFIWSDIVWVTHDIYLIRCCFEPDQKSVFGLILYWIDCNQLLSDQRWTVGVFNHTWSDVVVNLIRRVFLVLLVWDEYFWNWLIRYWVFLMLCWTWSEECFWSGERDSWEWSESSSSRHTHLYFGVLLGIILDLSMYFCMRFRGVNSFSVFWMLVLEIAILLERVTSVN